MNMEENKDDQQNNTVPESNITTSDNNQPPQTEQEKEKEQPSTATNDQHLDVNEQSKSIEPQVEQPKPVEQLEVLEQPKPVEVVEQPKPIEVVEQPKPIEVVEQPKIVEVVEQPKIVKVVEQPKPIEVVEQPKIVEVVEQQPKEVEVAPVPVLVSVVDRKCQTHPDKSCDAYCKECLLIICEQCTKESHKQHEAIDKLTAEELKSLLPTVNYFATDALQLKAEKQNMTAMLQKLEENYKSCRSSIVEQFKDLQFLIRQREMKLEKEIQTEYDHSKAELIKRIALLERELSHTNPLLEPATSFQTTATADELFDKRFEFLENYSQIKQIPRFEHEPPVELTIQFEIKVSAENRAIVTKEIQSLGAVTPIKKSTAPPATPGATSTPVQPTSPKVTGTPAPTSPALVVSPKNHRESKTNLTQGLSANEGYKYFYSIGGWNENGTDLSSIYRFDVEKNEWRMLPSKGLPSTAGIPFVSASCITDGKYIYVFGGNYTSSTYRRFNLSKQQWEKSLEKINRSGGSIAAQYDGKKYVYLFGGKVLDESKNVYFVDNSIERLNTSTKQIDLISNLTLHKYTLYPCFDPSSGLIYLVGGQVSSGRACKEIEVYDTVHNTVSVFSSLGSGGLVHGAVIDGKYESIYYITTTQFRKFTIATKKFETLEFPVLTNTTCRPSLIYDSKTRIYLFDQNDNYFYDIPTGKWNKFSFTRKVALCGQGMVGSMI